MTRINGRLIVSMLLTWTAMTFGTSGLRIARAESPAETADSRDNSGMEEIVVTARRREENAQTVPVSISAFSAQALTNAGVESTNDLQMLVPGVVLNGAGSDANTTYTIRGQGKAVIGPGLPSVITYFDEVPLPSWGSNIPTFDVSNVQVLKGPQGTLFGRNTTGGAVLVYSAAPEFTTNGYIQGEFGNLNDHSFQGAVNVPLINDILAVRIAGDIERRNGYTRNVLSGERDDNIDSDAVRVSILFKPTEAVSDTLVYDYYDGHNRTAIVPISPPLDPAYAPYIAAAQPNGVRSFASIVPSISNVTLWGITNTAKVDLDWFTVKDIFGYRSTNVFDAATGSGLGSVPLPLSVPTLGLTAGTPGILIDTVTQRVDRQISDELQFAGSGFGDTLNWLVGAFYLDDAPKGPDYLTEDLFRPTTPSPTTSFIVNNFLGGIWPIGSQVDNLYQDQSRAAFGNLGYELSKLWDPLRGITLNAGVRYTWDSEGVCANARPAISLATGQSVVSPFQNLGQCRSEAAGYVISPANPYNASFSQSVNYSSPTYTLGVDYKLNDNVFLYFTTRKGYRSGNLNSPDLAGSPLAPYQNFEPQKVTDYEIGAHTNWAAGSWRGRFNIDAFTGKFDALQLQATGLSAGTLPGLTAANAPSGTSVTLNAGNATIEGMELDGAVSPFSDLTISYGAAYLNPKYDTFTVPGFLIPFFSSGPFTGSPRWTYSADARYKLPTPATFGNVYFDADYYHIAKQYQGYLLVDQYSLTNLNLQWMDIAHKGIDVTLFVENLANKEYIHNSLLSTTSFGVFSGDYGPPRTYGVRIRYSFGK